MKKRNLKPTQTAPVKRPQTTGSTSRDPLAMFAAGGVGALRDCENGGLFCDYNPFAGDDAE